MIKFFGCSFTEGGGLDNIEYYNFLNNTNLVIDPNKTGDENDIVYKKLEAFRDEHKFSKIISNNLNTETKNLAISRGSNGYIFETLFNEIENNKNEIYVVVLTVLPRVYWYYEPTNEKYNLNSFEFNLHPYRSQPIMKNLADMYENYLKYVFNTKVEKQKIQKQIKLFDLYSKQKQSKIYWVSWEEFKELNTTTDNYITFDKMDLSQFVDKNKLQIFHHTNGVCTDNHISIYGNKIIADIIGNVIKN